jgi:ribosomal protein S15P/S13E
VALTAVLIIPVDEQGVLLCAPPKLFATVARLRRYLEEEDPPKSLLRLIYVCNNEEAINYLSGAFGISGSSKETGERSFREWMQDDRDTRRASHKGIRWRPAFDIARGMLCTAFGLDFGSLVVAESEQIKAQKGVPSNPRTFRQRIAVYMQRASSEALPGPRVTRFHSGSRKLHEMAQRDTIVICEYSSGEAGEIVSANVLLGLSPEPVTRGWDYREPLTPTRATPPPPPATQTLQLALSHIFDGLYQLWRDQIALIHEPHASLEDHIYAHPSDSSRARDVWAMSQRLHNMLKLVNRHSKVIEAVQDDFSVFAELGDVDQNKETSDPRKTWLTPLLDDFEVLAENIMTDYLQPLEHMIDLVRTSEAFTCCPSKGDCPALTLTDQCTTHRCTSRSRFGIRNSLSNSTPAYGVSAGSPSSSCH